MVAKRLKELRLASSASQADIAHILNISRVAYSFYENGKRQPNLESLSILADYYEVSVDYLIGRTLISLSCGRINRSGNQSSLLFPLL